MFNLSIIANGRSVFESYNNLRDARAAVVGYQNRNGYALTTEPWDYKWQWQRGTLRQNGTVIGTWIIGAMYDDYVTS